MKKERLIYLGLVAALFVVLIKPLLPVQKNSELTKKRFWIKKTFAPSLYDAVVIGDSRTYRGVDPKTISSKLNGMNTLNFGYSSGGFTSVFYNEGIKKLKDDGKKIVLLCITPFSLTEEACLNEHFNTERKHKKEEVIETMYFESIMAYFEPVNPQYILQKKYLMEKISEQDSLFYNEEYKENGWVASWKLKSEYNEAIDSYEKSFKRTGFNRAAINEFVLRVSESIKNGYKVYAIRPPVHSGLLDVENKYAADVYNEVKDNLIKSGVRWIEYSSVTDQSYDGSHLNKKGAIEFSSAIAEAIAEK